LHCFAGRGIIRDGFARSTDGFPLGTPGSWIAEGHVTCSIQCSARTCNRRHSVDLQLVTLPQDLPWSAIARRLVCKECGTGGSVNIVPNWHDMKDVRVPFTKSQRVGLPA
jgi:hypothetical protein